MPSPKLPPNVPPSDDWIIGATAIGVFVGMEPAQVYYALAKGYFGTAVWKLGPRKLIGSRKGLREFGRNGDVRPAAEPEVPPPPPPPVISKRPIPVLKFVERKRCVRCGRGGDLQLHHWAPRGRFADAEKWPKSWLCQRCHQRWHQVMDSVRRDQAHLN